CGEECADVRKTFLCSSGTAGRSSSGNGLTNPISEGVIGHRDTEPRRKTGHELHEFHEDRQAVRAAFGSCSPATSIVCDRRKFVKFVAKFFRRQFFPQFTPDTEVVRKDVSTASTRQRSC